MKRYTNVSNPGAIFGCANAEVAKIAKAATRNKPVESEVSPDLYIVIGCIGSTDNHRSFGAVYKYCRSCSSLPLRD
jgi:hypothetical protein